MEKMRCMLENQDQQKGLSAGVVQCHSPGPKNRTPGGALTFSLSFSLPYFLSSFLSFFLGNSLTNTVITMTREVIPSERCRLIPITLETGILTLSLEK